MNSRVAVIFGGSGGIGSCLAQILSEKKWRVVIVARNHQKALSVAETLSDGSAFSADITSSEQVKSVMDQIQTQIGTPTAIVHCVGSILLKPAHMTRDEEWNEVIQLNLSSAFYVLRHGIQALSPSVPEGASLTFCSTSAAKIGLVNHEAISAAKAGLEGMVRSAAATYASRGVRINAVAPGLVQTPLSQRITSSEAALKASISMHPMKRIGNSREIAQALEFLINPEQGWITGQILHVDGGLGNLKTL